MDIRQPSYGRGNSSPPGLGEEAFNPPTHAAAKSYCNPTSSIIDLFPQICSDFFVGKQEDAHEFLTRVLSSLCDPSSSSKSSLQAVLKRGVLCSRVVCSNCSTESRSQDEFFGIELEISRSHCLREALHEFCRTEVLSAATHNAFHCGICSSADQQRQQLQSARKSLRLLQLPRLLCLQLKRFSCEQMAPWRGSKLCHWVQYPIHLDMSPYCTPSTGSGSSSSLAGSGYRLSAVIVHRGSLDGGHYVTYVRSYDHHHCEDSDRCDDMTWTFISCCPCAIGKHYLSSIHLSISHPSTYLSIYLSSIHPSTYLSIHPSSSHQGMPVVAGRRLEGRAGPTGGSAVPVGVRTALRKE